MSKIYAAAITELEKGQFAEREVLFEIARKSPGAYVSAVQRLRERDSPHDWKKKCAQLMRSGMKVEAIRACRLATGMGLTEAKAAVEVLPLD